MAATDPEQSVVPPTEQRGGTNEGGSDKGGWVEGSDQGIVPADLGGSDAPPELLDDDPELGSSVLGTTTGSDESATEAGIDLRAGDDADATVHGGPDVAEERDEPTQRDAATVHTRIDAESDR